MHIKTNTADSFEDTVLPSKPKTSITGGNFPAETTAEIRLNLIPTAFN